MSALFVQDGQHMIFRLPFRSTKSREQIKAAIVSHGGRVHERGPFPKNKPTYVLVDPSAEVAEEAGAVYYTTYVEDSIKAGVALPIEKYLARNELGDRVNVPPKKRARDESESEDDAVSTPASDSPTPPPSGRGRGRGRGRPRGSRAGSRGAASPRGASQPASPRARGGRGRGRGRGGAGAATDAEMRVDTADEDDLSVGDERPAASNGGDSAGPVQSHVDDRAANPSVQTGNVRNPYTPSEDAAIVQYLLQLDADRIFPMGNAVWVDMASKKVVTRPWQSVRSHFNRIILPSLPASHPLHAKLHTTPRATPQKAGASSTPATKQRRLEADLNRAADANKVLSDEQARRALIHIVQEANNLEIVDALLIVHAFNGNISHALSFIRGNTAGLAAPWSPEEDDMLMSTNPASIAKLAATRSEAEIAARHAYLIEDYEDESS